VTLVLTATPALACMSDQSSQEVAEGKLTIATARDAAVRPAKPYVMDISEIDSH
jgi:hypothetical protein